MRTLHPCDAIGLLAPAYVGDNGYRYYGRARLLRLQQILFYRQLNMSLGVIAQTLDAPDFDLALALQVHRKRLLAEQIRFSQLLQTIDETISELQGEEKMAETNPLKMANPFEGFSPERQSAYEKELVEKYGQKAHVRIDESKTNLKKLSQTQMDEVKEEGHRINLGLVACIEAGNDAGDDDVQKLIKRHHAWVSVFWVPNRVAYIGLGQSYCENGGFRGFYNKYDSRLVAFLAMGMKIYAEMDLN